MCACVRTCRYVWEGKVEEDNELLLMIKTNAAVKEQVIKQVTDLHQFDVPEVRIVLCAAMFAYGFLCACASYGLRSFDAICFSSSCLCAGNFHGHHGRFACIP